MRQIYALRPDGTREWEEIPKRYNGCLTHGKICKSKHCPHCGAEYVNYLKHLRSCGEYKALVHDHARSHKAYTDTDMRLSGRTRSGGLDS